MDTDNWSNRLGQKRIPEPVGREVQKAGITMHMLEFFLDQIDEPIRKGKEKLIPKFFFKFRLETSWFSSTGRC